MSLRTILTSFLRRHGYAIGKYPAVNVPPIPVFPALVNQLMVARGPQLTVIQVGANDGKGFGDPLRRFFDEHPWRGVLIEPQTDVCAVLRRNYSKAPGKLTFENVAISPGSGSIVMYRQKHGPSVSEQDATYESSVVSTDPNVLAKQLSLKPEDIERFEVPCMTLDAIIGKHRLADIDILQVDTEGYERAVLETLSLEKHRPRLIQFEHGHMRPHDITAVFQRLASHGYRMLFGGRQIDSLACHESALAEMGIG